MPASMPPIMKKKIPAKMYIIPSFLWSTDVTHSCTRSRIPELGIEVVASVGLGRTVIEGSLHHPERVGTCRLFESDQIRHELFDLGRGELE